MPVLGCFRERFSQMLPIFGSEEEMFFSGEVRSKNLVNLFCFFPFGEPVGVLILWIKGMNFCWSCENCPKFGQVYNSLKNTSN